MYSTLSIGEKIRQVRELKGLSIENIANAINKNISTISRFERGELELSPEVIAEIVKVLEIEKAPLQEHELMLYRDRLRVWIDFITKGRFAEARAMNEEMSVILDLPFEHDLYLLYVLAEATFLCMEYNVQASAEKLSIVEDLLDNASHEALNLYHRNKGFICGYANDLISSIKHSLKAVEHAEADKKSDTFALNNIGFAYHFLGKPYQAIIYFERSKTLHQLKNDITSITNGIILSALGDCYLCVGANRKAEELLKLTISQSKSVNEDASTGQALWNMARLKLSMKLYEECIDFCDQALIYNKESIFSKGNNSIYIGTLVTKAWCMLEMKKQDECRELLMYARALLKDSKHGVVKSSMDNDSLLIMLSASEHLMTLDDNNSVNYIQNVAIPHFRASGLSKFTALSFCSKLESHYNKKRTKSKANAIAAIARDILEETLMGEIELE